MPLLNDRFHCSVQMTCDGAVVRERVDRPVLGELVEHAPPTAATGDSVSGSRLRRVAGDGVAGGRRRSSATDPADLLLDEHGGPRDRLEPLTRDGPAGLDGVAVGAVGEAGERGVDVGDASGGPGR